ncbi:MAG: hypothetical protein QM504_12575 [Pseudomonadota bacterium]
MINKDNRFVELTKLVDYHIGNQLNSKQLNSLYRDISRYLNAPDSDDFKLEVIAVKVIQLGANYESYVSALLFKSMPENFTRKELQTLEEELYRYIEKDLYGKGMDKLFTNKLIEQTLRLVPNSTRALTEKKAIGNWGWLIPHALTQVIIEAILKKIQMAVLEDKKINRKGRIRIKKML